MFLVKYLIIMIIAYLMGSFPSGYLSARIIAGVDVRKIGSGRTGGTNVWRAAGPWAFMFTVLGDLFKGTLAVGLAMLLLPEDYLAHGLAGVAAVAGHIWPIFLHFKGGAGSMTALSILVVLSLPTALIVSFCALVAIAIWRYASVGSLVLAFTTIIAFIILTIWKHYPAEYILYSIVTAALITYSLRPNIKRLRAGTERKIGVKDKAT